MINNNEKLKIDLMQITEYSVKRMINEHELRQVGHYTTVASNKM